MSHFADALSICTDIHWDAENEVLVLRRLDEHGEVITDLPQIWLSLYDLQYAGQVGGAPIQMVCRRAHYVDGLTGAKKRIYLLATIGEDDATDDGHSVSAVDAGVAVQDLHLGGGGGGAQRMRVKSVDGDYLTCRTWDGTTEGSYDIAVAKPPHLRHSLTSQNVNGVTVSYGSFGITGGMCQRTASAGGYVTQTEWVLPVWQIAGTGTDAEIWADMPAGGTGVEGTTLMDTNRDARAWCQVS